MAVWKFSFIILLASFHVTIQVIASSVLDNFKNNLLLPIDNTTEPCTDFYEYACGNWENLNVNLSTDHFGPDSLEIVKQKISAKLVQLLTNEDTATEDETPAKKTQRFYSSCLNKSDEDGLVKLTSVLKSISDWPILNQDWKAEDFDWLAVVSKLRLYGVRAIINEAVGPHWNSSDIQIIYFVSPKFDFVHKADLLGTSRNSEEFVFFYKRYIKMLMLRMGIRIRKAKEISNEIVAFETKLAELIPNEEEITPPEPVTVQLLSSQIPQIDWVKYLSGVLERPIDSATLKVIIHDEYYRKLASLISQTESRTVADYLLFKFMFNFKVAVEDKHTSSQCLQDTTKRMGTIGEMFVRRYSQLENRQAVSQIVDNVQAAFRTLVNSSSWLDLPTKQSALNKLEAMTTIIAYPDHILTAGNVYKSLEINANDYYTNCLNLARYETKQEHDQLYTGQRPWTPSAVDSNAFYKTTKNAIFIPAGLLLPPIFDTSFPNFHKFAVLGSIVGHELTHGFDFEGRNYDSKGSVRNWWSTKSLIGYYSHMECILSQHNNFSSTQPRRFRGGIGSISENVADNGGIRLAYRAYKASDGEKEEVSGVNMTGEQLFFLSFAQFWCSSNKKGQEGSHALNKYRVIGSLSNLPQFAHAFGCPAGSTMNPIRKCELW